MLLHSRLLLLTLCILLSNTGVSAENEIVGNWITIDDKTNSPRSVVELSMKNGELFGDIRKIFYRDGENEDGICSKCAKNDLRFEQKILGMTIITGLKKNLKSGKWEDGRVLDPDNGKVYRCELWLENGDLKLRGFIMFLYRTQTWHRSPS